MIACLDVHYEKAQAYAASVLFQNWTDSRPVTERVVPVTQVEPYEPGQFYRRELPCLMAAIRELPPVDVVVVDGYVWLDVRGKPGLGAHLFEALERKVAVIGVAKTPFGHAAMAWQIIRGKSSRPLFVSAAGMPAEAAATAIASMHGDYRIPTLLKRVDFLCRNPGMILNGA